MPNYKKSFFLSFFIHLGIIFLVIVLVLFFHIKYKKKETFIEVKLYKTSKSVSRHHKAVHKKSISYHKIIKHYAKHTKRKKRVVHKHHVIKHLLKHRKITKKHTKTIKSIRRKTKKIKHKSAKKKLIRHIKEAKSYLKPTAVAKAIIAKGVKTINKIKYVNVTLAMAKKIRHDYFDYLYKLINTYKTYPIIARELQQEGVVKVSFLLLNNGEILHVKIIKSSDFNSLDDAAKAIFTHLHKIKPIPKALSLKPLHLIIPIDYTLH